ncbi:hypothetical protein B1B_06803, partial [mine drainage metagenome]
MYPDRQSLAMLATQITAALRSIPGVETAAASDLPLHNDTYDYAFKLPDGHEATVATRAISRDYLQAVRLSLLRGRPFDHADFHDGAAVALVNATFAKRYLHDAALGQLLSITPKKGHSPRVAAHRRGDCECPRAGPGRESGGVRATAHGSAQCAGLQRWTAFSAAHARRQYAEHRQRARQGPSGGSGAGRRQTA